MLSPNATPPLDQGAEDPPLGTFVPTEKSPDHAGPTQSANAEDAPPAVSAIAAAFAACRAVGGGDGVFGNAWMDRLIEVVQPAYDLLWLTHNKPPELARLARMAEIPFTKATEKNVPLLCVKLAARPKEKDTDHHKLCSDWSTLLSCALAQNILPDEFIAWVGTTTVRKCKATIAREKAAARTEAGQLPRKRNQTQFDAARAGGALGSAAELSDVLTKIQTAVLEELTAPGTGAERHERVAATLQGFVNSHAVREEIGSEHDARPVIMEVADD
jgi:hypothetical protein